MSELSKSPTLPSSWRLTCVTHELPWDLLVAAAAAEDLTAQSAVVTAPEGGELFVAVITFLTLAVGHPVLLQVAVLRADEASVWALRDGPREALLNLTWLFPSIISFSRFSAVRSCTAVRGSWLLRGASDFLLLSEVTEPGDRGEHKHKPDF